MLQAYLHQVTQIQTNQEKNHLIVIHPVVSMSFIVWLLWFAVFWICCGDYKLVKPLISTTVIVPVELVIEFLLANNLYPAAQEVMEKLLDHNRRKGCEHVLLPSLKRLVLEKSDQSRQVPVVLAKIGTKN